MLKSIVSDPNFIVSYIMRSSLQQCVAILQYTFSVMDTHLESNGLKKLQRYLDKDLFTFQQMISSPTAADHSTASSSRLCAHKKRYLEKCCTATIVFKVNRAHLIHPKNIYFIVSITTSSANTYNRWRMTPSHCIQQILNSP